MSIMAVHGCGAGGKYTVNELRQNSPDKIQGGCVHCVAAED